MSDTISCELKISTELASRPFYKALSYTWGSLLPARQILVNGEPFTVRENLYQFLRTIHHEKPTFFFFIDQICIDQSNVQERNHQVNFMGQIYHEAIQVVAWLGPAADGSDEAMFWISRSQSHTSHYRRNDPVSLNYLFQRAYWKRIWILQEIMLA
ncbi:heterokaryon incompatibility, partial [Lophium mytilinum]